MDKTGENIKDTNYNRLQSRDRMARMAPMGQQTKTISILKGMNRELSTVVQLANLELGANIKFGAPPPWEETLNLAPPPGRREDGAWGNCPICPCPPAPLFPLLVCMYTFH